MNLTSDQSKVHRDIEGKSALVEKRRKGQWGTKGARLLATARSTKTHLIRDSIHAWRTSDEYSKVSAVNEEG